jgi:hypothetical protein
VRGYDGGVSISSAAGGSLRGSSVGAGRGHDKGGAGSPGIPGVGGAGWAARGSKGHATAPTQNGISWRDGDGKAIRTGNDGSPAGIVVSTV